MSPQRKRFQVCKSSVGILTFGWAATARMQEFEQVKIKLEIKWTPVMLIFMVNVANELAKEAAEEAEQFPEYSETLTNAEFKKFARASCRIQWQIGWEAAENGRFLVGFNSVSSHKSQ